MHVIAYSTPNRPDWTWRIINNAGEVVEESRARFPTISAAVSEGTGRLKQLNIKDTSTAAKPGRRSTSHLRRR
jgi:hypothetical protein